MAVKTFLLKNSAASGSTHGSLQDGGSVTTATTTTGFLVGTTAATNYALQTYNSIVNVWGATAEPAAAPSTTDSWRSESRLTGGFAAGTWAINLSVIASGATASGSGAIGLRIWKSANANGSSAVELTSGASFTTQWSNLTTSTAQNLTATASVSATDFNNEFLFFQLAMRVDSASSSGTAEVRFRVDGTNSRLVTTSFSDALNGNFLGEDTLLSGINKDLYYNGDINTELGLEYSGINKQLYYVGDINTELPLEYSGLNNNMAYAALLTIESDIVPAVTYYMMRAIDPDCPTLTYVSWVVQNAPDFSGSQYAGARCGGSLLINIVITASWRV